MVVETRNKTTKKKTIKNSISHSYLHNFNGLRSHVTGLLFYAKRITRDAQNYRPVLPKKEFLQKFCNNSKLT
jgi:hypothetical protein